MPSFGLNDFHGWNYGHFSGSKSVFSVMNRSNPIIFPISKALVHRCKKPYSGVILA